MDKFLELSNHFARTHENKFPELDHIHSGADRISNPKAELVRLVIRVVARVEVLPALRD